MVQGKLALWFIVEIWQKQIYFIKVTVQQNLENHSCLFDSIPSHCTKVDLYSVPKNEEFSLFISSADPLRNNYMEGSGSATIK